MELETTGKFNVLPPRPYASGRLHKLGTRTMHSYCCYT